MFLRNILAFVLGIFIVVGLTTCKKRQARKTLEGDWKVTSYNILITGACEFGDGYFIESGGDHGQVHFDKKTFEMDYEFSKEGSECDVDTVYENAGEWLVTDHNRQFLIGHEYRIELDGESWIVIFSGPNGGWQKANGSQDLVYLSHVLADGGFVYLDLVRQ